MERKLEMVIQAGRILLEAGAEVYRVQETVDRMGQAAGLNRLESYVTPTGIIVSYEGESGHLETTIHRVARRSINLQRIVWVNDLSRRYAAGQTDCEEALEELASIDSQRRFYPLTVHILSISLAAAALALLNGGGWTEFVAAFLISVVLHFFLSRIGLLAHLPFLRELSLGVTSALLAYGGASFLGYTPAYVIVGILLSVIPGASVVNSIRDLIAGDLISGAARGAEALVFTLALFGGAGMVIKLLGGI